ncbi:F-box/WD repeat-containing protein 10 [Xenentodon cancila]
MCGICPSCVFSPKAAGSSRRLWKMSDELERRFLVALLLRCRNAKVLENIQRLLSITPGTCFTYSRSRSPPSLPDRSYGRSDQTLAAELRGIEMKEIWTWFHRSPDWMKTSYLCRIFSMCDMDILLMLSNLTSVLLIRHKQGFLHFSVSDHNLNQYDQGPEEPALMVVPGSSRSASGVSQYRDFISCLPVNLSKRILGLLEEPTLRCCKKVCRHWQHLSEETLQEIKFRRIFQNQIKALMEGCRGVDRVSPTYASIVEVEVLMKDDEEEDVHCSVNKVEPPKAACDKNKTQTVQMEERNVYCGAFFTQTLLNKTDPHRVLDYRGGLLMATGSKDCVLHLLRVASETKDVAVMKGHVGSILVVLLCEDRDLLISAGCDASIRCWSLKTNRCEMVLYGHTGTINCLDVHADRLVSGAKDCTVKVWSLHTRKLFKDLHFKHPSSVKCVKINKATVCSSCERGLVKIWSMENASLLRVIAAHKSSVKCLFFDEWFLLSGDSHGKVMAWSINRDAKKCLQTFNHPKGVKSLTLLYLRVITGCVDGKIRIFNFLTGDCLRDIMIESDSGRLLSLHFLDQSILVNTTTQVLHYQFAKIFWDYTDSTWGEMGDVGTRGDLVSERSAVLSRKSPYTSSGGGDVTPPTPKIHDVKPQIPEMIYQTRFLPTSPKSQKTQVPSETAKQSVIRSEKATRERIRKRGPHHPLTRDAILLRVGAIQRALRVDEVSRNMESNARLRDSWGGHSPQDSLQPDVNAAKLNLQCQRCPPQPPRHHRRPKTCVPILKPACEVPRQYNPHLHP